MNLTLLECNPVIIMLKPVKSIFRQMGLGLAQQHAPEMSATIHKKEKRNKHFDLEATKAMMVTVKMDANKTETDIL